MTANEIKLPRAITSESDSGPDNCEDIDTDQPSQASSSGKCAPVHRKTSKNITACTTSNINCFYEQQSATSTLAGLNLSFTVDDLSTRATQQNEYTRSSVSVSRRSRNSARTSEYSSSSTKPSFSRSLSADNTCEDIDVDANVVRRSRYNKRSCGPTATATSLGDEGNYEDIDAIKSRRGTSTEQNTSQQFNNAEFLYNGHTAPDDINRLTNCISSLSGQSATSSSDTSNITHQSESSSPDTSETRFGLERLCNYKQYSNYRFIGTAYNRTLVI
jgi:hypothetical protein